MTVSGSLETGNGNGKTVSIQGQESPPPRPPLPPCHHLRRTGEEGAQQRQPGEDPDKGAEPRPEGGGTEAEQGTGAVQNPGQLRVEKEPESAAAPRRRHPAQTCGECRARRLGGPAPEEPEKQGEAQPSGAELS